MVEVVQLRSAPTLNDIPGQLRQLADEIERGEVKATSALCILPQDDNWPTIFGWGEHMGDYANIGVLELAKAFFVNNTTTRAS